MSIQPNPTDVFIIEAEPNNWYFCSDVDDGDGMYYTSQEETTSKAVAYYELTPQEE